MTTMGDLLSNEGRCYTDVIDLTAKFSAFTVYANKTQVVGMMTENAKGVKRFYGDIYWATVSQKTTFTNDLQPVGLYG